jgi:hypothetical protein
VPMPDGWAGGGVDAAVATVRDGGVAPQAGMGADMADGPAKGVCGKNRESIATSAG